MPFSGLRAAAPSPVLVRAGRFAAASLLCIGWPSPASESAPDAGAARTWALEHAMPLQRIGFGGPRADLEGLGKMVGDARVVGFGEAMHGGHEFVEFRNQLFEYLVEEMGFTAIAAETDFVDGFAIDDYVAGVGELTPALVAGVFSFGAPALLRENRQLLEWMRSYNARPDVGRKLRFYGLDMMGRSLRHDQPIPDRPLGAALRYVADVDPESSRRFDERVRPVLRMLAAGKGDGYAGLPPRQRDAFTVAIADLAALFERRQVQWIEDTSELAYERAYRSVLNARALDADMRANGWWACERTRGRCDLNQRDAASARNLLWALDSEGEDGRILLFEHNVHVCKRLASGSLGQSDFTPIGEYLRVRLGSKMVVIGSFFGRPVGFRDSGDERQDGLSPVLGGTKHAALALDLRLLASAGPVAAWWNRRISNGPGGHALNPVECFDALVFFENVTPWHVSSP